MKEHFNTYKEGEKLSLTCDVEGFPPAKIEWKKNDEDLPYDDRITINGNLPQRKSIQLPTL